MKQPKYAIGQPVIVDIETSDSATRKKFLNKITMFIRSIRADSDTEGVVYMYGLTVDFPAAYHYGESESVFLPEAKIVLAH